MSILSNTDTIWSQIPSKVLKGTPEAVELTPFNPAEGLSYTLESKNTGEFMDIASIVDRYDKKKFRPYRRKKSVKIK